MAIKHRTLSFLFFFVMRICCVDSVFGFSLDRSGTKTEIFLESFKLVDAGPQTHKYNIQGRYAESDGDVGSFNVDPVIFDGDCSNVQMI